MVSITYTLLVNTIIVYITFQNIYPVQLSGEGSSSGSTHRSSQGGPSNESVQLSGEGSSRKRSHMTFQGEPLQNLGITHMTFQGERLNRPGITHMTFQGERLNRPESTNMLFQGQHFLKPDNPKLEDLGDLSAITDPVEKCVYILTKRFNGNVSAKDCMSYMFDNSLKFSIKEENGVAWNYYKVISSFVNLDNFIGIRTFCSNNNSTDCLENLKKFNIHENMEKEDVFKILSHNFITIESKKNVYLQNYFLAAKQTINHFKKNAAGVLIYCKRKYHHQKPTMELQHTIT